MGGPSTNGVDVGFPFGDASSLGMTYGGFSKLKHEFSQAVGGAAASGSGISSRPPWAAAALPPPLAGSANVAAPKSAAPLPPEFASHHHHHHQQNHHHLQQQGQFLKQDRLSFLAAHNAQTVQPAASTGRLQHDLHAGPFSASLPYEAQVHNLYKSSLGSSSCSTAAFGAAGGLNFGKERGRHYPLQYNGGSLVLDHHRSELINLSKMTPQEILDAKALAASKSHSEAERRRRERINNHLNTLRGLLPSTTKTDKASLLAEVIEHVKDLKRQAAEIAEGGPVPTDVDELKVDTEPSSSDGSFVLKASLCCDDRPDLLTDLTKALRTLKLKTLKAEISTLGGRVKNVILIGKDKSVGNQADGEQERSPTLSCVQDALRAVIERSSDVSASAYGSGKRQKMNSTSAAAAAAAAASSQHHDHHQPY